MLDSIAEFFERLLAVLLLPATLWGAGGAIVNVRRQGQSIRQSVVEIIFGSFTAHMFSGAIIQYVPDVWHSVGYFLAGMGGLKFIGRLYEVTESAVIRRIGRKIDGE